MDTQVAGPAKVGQKKGMMSGVRSNSRQSQNEFWES